MTLTPSSITTQVLQGFLQSLVVPRPIALCSTISARGDVNLSPFSFFNLFSSNPPIVVFSPAIRVRDSTPKHTLENMSEVPEVVVHIPDYTITEQVSLSSCEYPRGVNEFVKAGFTAVPSIHVKPPRVGEALVAMECRVNQIVSLGKNGGAGNLVVAEIICLHIADKILKDGKPDLSLWEPIARLGGDLYCRVNVQNIFTVPKPNQKLGIGFDQLPDNVRRSPVFNANHLGRLANIDQLPDSSSVHEFQKTDEWKKAHEKGEVALHHLAVQFLEKNDIISAWKAIL